MQGETKQVNSLLKLVKTIFLNNKLVATHLFFIFFNGACHSASAQFESLEAHYKKLKKQSEEKPVAIQFVQEEMGLLEDYDNLNQIILLRHGEPALNKKGWRKRKEAVSFIIEYDSVGVYPPGYIPIKIRSNEIEVIFTSTLNRSISTAEQLFQRPEDQRADAIFREFERKIFSFPNIKLPLNWWLTGSRVFWFMGLNKKGIESFSEAKLRAKGAVAFLEKNTYENGKTLLVSHGLLNHYLAKYLMKNGWTEVFDGGKGYLSQKILVKYK